MASVPPESTMEPVRSVQKRRLLRVDVQKIAKNRRRKIKESIKRLKADMAEICKDHKHVKEGHAEINLKLISLDSECEKLKEGTEAIALQNSENQKRLDLMFAILRARQQNDFSTADPLAHRLREISK